MTDYLKQFIERATDVPMQLRRRLALLRDLDEKAVQLHREIDEQYKKLLVEKSQTASKRQKGNTGDESEVLPTFDLELQLKKLIGLSDDKVNIANQIYDFMDKHINTLDADLQALDAEIEADRRELGLEDDETASEQLGIEAPKGALPAALARAAELQKKKKRGKREEGGGLPAAAALPPLENEPAYCICHKPSSGQMVGCDNPECAIEWFHYECVGLKADPVGKWYCPVCRGEQKLTKRAKKG